MPLKDSVPPAGVLARLREHFNGDVSRPHAIFDLLPESILGNNPLSNVILMGWRFFAKGEGGKPVVYELHTGQNEGEFIYSGYQFGEMVEEHAKILDLYSNHNDLKNHEYAFLSLFHPKVRSVWFRGKEGNPDFFFPLSPMFYGLQGKLYSTKDFLEIIKSAIDGMPIPKPGDKPGMDG